MLADVDFDIVAHLGFIQNIDMEQKGIYVVQAGLYCGEIGRKIAPVGLFSAPSNMDSFVDTQKVPSANNGSVCEVDDSERKFRSRSFIIRYKNEKHELNEGVHWRLTLPKYDIKSTTGVDNLPLCTELLQLKFELMYCPLKDDPDGLVDMFKDVDKLVPSNPVFGLVATQSFIIQQAGSGIHEYFPIRFDSAHYMDMDCMVHCAVTGIRYNKVSLSAVTDRRLRAQVQPIVTEHSGDSGSMEGGLSSSSSSSSVDDISVALIGEESEKSAVSLDGLSSAGGQKDMGAPLRQLPVTPQKQHLAVQATQSPYSTVISQYGSAEDLSSLNGSGVFNFGSGRSAMLSHRSGSINFSSTFRRLSGLMTHGAQPDPHRGASEESDNAIRKLKTSLASTHRQMGSADSAKSHQSIELSRSAASTNSSSVAISSQASLASLDSGALVNGETSGTSSESEGEMHHSEAQDAVSPPQLTAECGLLQYEVDALYASYSRAMVANYRALFGGTDAIIHVGADAHWAVDSSFSGSPGEEADRESACVFEAQRSSVFMDISKVATTAEVVDLVQRQINACNTQFTQRWSLLLSAVKRSMPGIRLLLRTKYLARMQSFWRRQMLVHTKSIAETNRALPAEEAALVAIVVQQMRSETQEAAVRMSDSGKRVAAGGARDESIFLARGLRIFDADFHAYAQKIPHLILQQYVSGLHHENYTPQPKKVPLPPKRSVAASAAVADPIPEGVFDSTLKSGSVCLAFGGCLLHCLDDASSLMDGSEQKVVDISTLPSLVPLFGSAEDGARFVQTRVDKLRSDALAAEEAEVTNDREEASSPCGFGASDPAADAKARLASSLRTDHSATDTAPIVRPSGIDISDRSRFSISKLSSKLSKHSAFATKQPAFDARSDTTAKVRAAPLTKPTKNHLVVLQHGFLGTSYDMRLIENAITMEMPNNFQVFCPKSNLEHSQDSIAQMAKRMAFEVMQYCKDKMPALLSRETDCRVSFVGHSMGGLIIRLALQEVMMKPLLAKLHAFMSLATPHVGTLFADSQLVSTGMWALFKFKKCRSLRELVLEDAIGGKLKKSLLYKLSLNGVLGLFRKVVLVSSPKDMYVPTYSARIQVSRKIESDEEVGPVIAQMTHNLLSQLRDDQLVRVTLDNNIGEDTATVDALIGRTAHICYLENQAVATQLVATLLPYFL